MALKMRPGLEPKISAKLEKEYYTTCTASPTGHYLAYTVLWCMCLRCMCLFSLREAYVCWQPQLSYVNHTTISSA